MIPVLVICAVAVLVIVLVAANHKTTINLSKYISITASGYDTVGTASYDFDFEQFKKDYDGKIKVDKKACEKLLKEARDSNDELNGSDAVLYLESNSNDPVDTIYDFAYGSVNPASGLSNGDTVTYSWEIEQDILEGAEKIFNCRFKTDDVTLKVKDLEKAQTFDPFDGVEINYDGYAPDGRVQNISEGTDPACEGLHYKADKTDGLSNGDTITVTVSTYSSDDMNEYLLKNYGKIPSETSKEFTVSGLSSYAASASEIPDEAMEQMKSQAEDVFNANVASNWDSKSEKLKDFQYIGNYFLSQKPGGYQDQNFIYLVYKVRAHLWITNDDGEKYDNNIDYYWYCRFSDILLTGDDQCSVDLSSYRTPENDYANFTVNSGVSDGWWDKSWNLSGYEDLDYMYNQLITVRIADYNSENNVEDVSLGNTDGKDSDSGKENKDRKKDSADSEEAETADEESDEILPFSSDRALTEDDVEGLDKDELQTAINEIYARHGYTFKDKKILAYFEQYDWYQPTIASSDFSLDMLTQLERENIDFIQEHMK